MGEKMNHVGHGRRGFRGLRGRFGRQRRGLRDRQSHRSHGHRDDLVVDPARVAGIDQTQQPPGGALRGRIGVAEIFLDCLGQSLIEVA